MASRVAKSAGSRGGGGRGLRQILQWLQYRWSRSWGFCSHMRLSRSQSSCVIFALCFLNSTPTSGFSLHQGEGSQKFQFLYPPSDQRLTETEILFSDSTSCFYRNENSLSLFRLRRLEFFPTRTATTRTFDQDPFDWNLCDQKTRQIRSFFEGPESLFFN